MVGLIHLLRNLVIRQPLSHLRRADEDYQYDEVAALPVDKSGIT